LRKEINRTT
jgi:hypothetical protein